MRSWRAAGPGIVSLELEGACAELILYEDGSVRLRAKAGRSLSPSADLALGRESVGVSSAEPRAGPSEGGFCIEHNGPRGRTRVEICDDPFCLSITEGGGSIPTELRHLAFATDGVSLRCDERGEPGSSDDNKIEVPTR